MINLYVSSLSSFKVLGFANKRDRATHLKDFDARPITAGVWKLSDGSIAAWSESALERYEDLVDAEVWL